MTSATTWDFICHAGLRCIVGLCLQCGWPLGSRWRAVDSPARPCMIRVGYGMRRGGRGVSSLAVRLVEPGACAPGNVLIFRLKQWREVTGRGNSLVVGLAFAGRGTWPQLITAAHRRGGSQGAG